MQRHVNVKIYGRVQGIFYRATAKEEADKLNIKGFVQNMPDGSVYIEAEGEKDQLDKFIKWCNSGPSMAKVEKIEVSEGQLKNFTGFEVS